MTRTLFRTFWLDGLRSDWSGLDRIYSANGNKLRRLSQAEIKSGADFYGWPRTPLGPLISLPHKVGHGRENVCSITSITLFGRNILRNENSFSSSTRHRPLN